MRPIATLLLLGLPLLSACNNLSTSIASSPATDSSAAPAIISQSAAQRLRGVLENGGAQLKPCNGTPVPLDTSADPDLMARLLAAQLEGDTRVQFIDLSGRMVKNEGDDEARLVPELIYFMSSAGQGCKDEEYPRLIVSASGHAPEWSVRVLPGGLLLQRPGQPARVLPYLEEQLPDGRMGFSSEANGERIELWLTPGRCTDSQNDAIHHLQASLRLNSDKPLSGCAAQGGARR